MSEIPPVTDEITDVVIPFDAPGGGPEFDPLAVSNGHDDLGGGEDLVEEEPGGAFGELEEEGDGLADVLPINARGNDADLLGDESDGAELHYPTFGNTSTDSGDDTPEEPGSEGATIHGINGSEPEKHSDAADPPADEAFDDTPQGSKGYPDELVRQADILIGKGDEDGAFRLLEEFERSQSPFVPIIEDEPEPPTDNQPDDDQTLPLF